MTKSNEIRTTERNNRGNKGRKNTSDRIIFITLSGGLESDIRNGDCNDKRYEIEESGNYGGTGG